MSAVDRILSLCSSQPGSVVEITSRIYVLRDRQKLDFVRRQNISDINLEIQREGEFRANNFVLSLAKTMARAKDFTPDPNVEYFDYDLIPAGLTLRSWKPGDAFTPLGMEGTMKLSDFLINEKVSLFDKDDILVLATKNDIIWVCGQRISDKFKITPQTKRVLKAVISRKKTHQKPKSDE
jgi:tRNA(Ile)-lysidine synthetase-like protein